MCLSCTVSVMKVSMSNHTTILLIITTQQYITWLIWPIYWCKWSKGEYYFDSWWQVIWIIAFTTSLHQHSKSHNLLNNFATYKCSLWYYTDTKWISKQSVSLFQLNKRILLSYQGMNDEWQVFKKNVFNFVHVGDGEQRQMMTKPL